MAKKEKVYEPMPDELLALQDEYIALDAEVKRLSERKAELQSTILGMMQSNSLRKAENDRIRISYIAPSVRKTFDKERFCEDHEDLYNKYVMDVETKASVRISIK